MSDVSGLGPGSALVSMLSSALTRADGVATAAAYQSGRCRQAIMGATDRVGDEPRLLIDFSTDPPGLTRHGRSAGHRSGQLVTMFGREHRLARRGLRWARQLRFDVTASGRTVLQVRENTRGNRTVRTFAVHTAPELDPVVALALIVLGVRPDRMGFDLAFAAG